MQKTENNYNSPISIGGLVLANRVFAAPMAGFSATPFRLLAREYGAGLAYLEMIKAVSIQHMASGSSTKVTKRKRKLNLILAVEPGEPRPIAAQLCGSEPAMMAEAAKLLESMGYDLIDINFGCPVRKIIATGDGVAMMRNPKLAGEIVAAIRNAVKIPVTAKMRAGWDAESINCLEFGKILADNGAQAITLHPRTRTQLYGGKSDWTLIQKLKSILPDSIIIGNGDVVDGPSAKRMFDETGCDALLVGRASLGNPWLFREINHYLETGTRPEPPDIKERRDVFMRHFGMITTLYGIEHGIKTMRKFVGLYTRGLPGRCEFTHQANLCKDQEEFVELAGNFFDAAKSKPNGG